METRANHIWVGAITMLLLAGLAAFAIWLAGLNEARQSEYDIFFKQSVNGLSRGSNVGFSGVPVGQVEEIALWKKDPEFVRVRISVNADVPILQGTTATILSSFTGPSEVQLDGAIKGAPPITDKGPAGVPVIPTKPGALGELLNNAPLLLERLGTLTDRLTSTLSDKNQESIEGILANTDRLTGSLADQAPQVSVTLAELRTTLAKASVALDEFAKVAGSADRLVNEDGKAIATDLRATLASARASAAELERTMQAAQPGMRQLNESTLPKAEALIRDLRATSKALRDITEKLDQQGASSLIGAAPLPDYEPGK